MEVSNKKIINPNYSSRHCSPTGMDSQAEELINRQQDEHTDPPSDIEIEISAEPSEVITQKESCFENTFNRIYFSHFLSAWGDRSWGYIAPLSLAAIFPSSLLLVSLLLFFDTIYGALFGSFIGTVVDSFPRISVVKVSLFLQNTMIVLSIVFIYVLSFFADQHLADPTSIWSDWRFVLCFVGLCFMNSNASLFSMASDIAVERDWVVTLCRNNHQLLSNTNAVMQRIDLGCKVAAPAALGFFLQVAGLYIVLAAVVVWNVISFFPELLILLSIYYQNADLLESKDEARLQKKSQQSELPTTEKDLNQQNSKEIEMEDISSLNENNQTSDDVGASVEIVSETPDSPAPNSNTDKEENVYKKLLLSTLKGWKLYFQYNICLASLAYVMLYWTVLSPGGLFNAYLRINNVKDWVLGTYGGIAAIIGLVATFVEPHLATKLGLKFTGLSSIWVQFAVLFPCILLFYSEDTWVSYLMMVLVSLARFPLWSFDLVERQIMQVSIAEKERGIINSVEGSLTRLATFGISFVAVLFPAIPQFKYLVLSSLISVFSAAFLFSLWCSWKNIPLRKQT